MAPGEDGQFWAFLGATNSSPKILWVGEGKDELWLTSQRPKIPRET